MWGFDFGLLQSSGPGFDTKEKGTEEQMAETKDSPYFGAALPDIQLTIG